LGLSSPLLNEVQAATSPALDHHTNATHPISPTMDLSSLKDQVSNLTLYDLKAGFRKAQNGTL